MEMYKCGGGVVIESNLVRVREVVQKHTAYYC